MEPPDPRHVASMVERFYLDIARTTAASRFISDPWIDPTNNLAEQAIRFVGIHRQMTQGTRSESGRTRLERICTTVVAGEQPGHSEFEFVVGCVLSHFSGAP